MMLALIPIICGNLVVIYFNTANKHTLPPVLQRMLGLDEGEFAPPKKDKEGNLTFAKDLKIHSKHLLDLFLFFRTGLLPDAPLKIEEMTAVMEMFGGSDVLDAALLEKKKIKEQKEEEKNSYNPMTPEQDVRNQYHWMQSTYNEKGWDVTISIPYTRSFYYRKLKT